MSNFLKYILVGTFVVTFDYGAKYPIIHWIFFYFYSIYSTYIVINSYKLSKKIKKLDVALLVLVLIFLFYLIKYKTYGWLIYPCIFTIVSIIVVIVFSLKPTTNKTPKHNEQSKIIRLANTKKVK